MNTDYWICFAKRSNHPCPSVDIRVHHLQTLRSDPELDLSNGIDTQQPPIAAINGKRGNDAARHDDLTFSQRPPAFGRHVRHPGDGDKRLFGAAMLLDLTVDRERSGQTVELETGGIRHG